MMDRETARAGQRVRVTAKDCPPEYRVGTIDGAFYRCAVRHDDGQVIEWEWPDVEPLALSVDHPPHYGGGDDPYEAIKVIEAWGLGFHLGNVVKYIARAGRKPGTEAEEDLRKAAWYLEREVNRTKESATPWPTTPTLAACRRCSTR